MTKTSKIWLVLLPVWRTKWTKLYSSCFRFLKTETSYIWLVLTLHSAWTVSRKKWTKRNLPKVQRKESLIRANIRKTDQMRTGHSDSKHYENWTKIIHCPTSSGASERSGARERTSERCERTSERISEWPITNIPILRGSGSLSQQQQQ